MVIRIRGTVERLEPSQGVLCDSALGYSVGDLQRQRRPLTFHLDDGPSPIDASLMRWRRDASESPRLLLGGVQLLATDWLPIARARPAPG
jgi:hypothetical protein